MQALETSTEMLPPATLRLVEDLPREVRSDAPPGRVEQTGRQLRAPRGPEGAPEGQTRRRTVPDGWHVPVCVLLSVGAHVLMTVFMPSAAALQPVAAEPDLMFMDLREVMLPVAPEPPPAPEPLVVPPPSEAQQPLTPPPAAAVTPAAPPPESEPAPSAPPPAAAEVLAATSAAAGGPAFTTGTAGGSTHGVGSTPTASETNPAATRPSEGTGTGVDMRGLMRGYMATLNGRVRPAVVYPRAAVIAGLEGTVMIGLLVDAQGNILRRRVKRSSGHTSLDTAVLEAAERLASVPAPPAELRTAWDGGPQEITVPIRMTLVR